MPNAAFGLGDPQAASHRAAGRRAALHRKTLALLGANLLVAATLSAIAALALQASRDAQRERAADTARGLAAAMAQTIAGQFAQIDIVLRRLAEAAQPAAPAGDALAAPALVQALRAESGRVAAIDSLRIADADGWIRHGAAGSARPVNVADRELFRRLRDEAAAGLLMTGPAQSRVDGRWILALARRIDGADGRFAGVAFANVPVEHFGRLFADVDTGPRGAITLRTSSLQLVARRAAGPDGAPPSAPTGGTVVSAQLAESLRTRPDAGHFVATTALDGIERVTAYVRVPGQPLVVLVGLASDDVLAPWQRQLVLSGALIAFVMLIVSGASLMLARAWAREAGSDDALVVQGRRYRALLRTAGDGIHVLDREGRIVELSDSFASMLGRDRAALLGQAVPYWDSTIPPQDVQRWLASFKPGETRRFETRHRRDDGTTFDVEIESTALELDGQTLIYCASRDITPLKQAQAERLRSVELEAENRRLMQWEGLRTNFLSSLSHELRTPLNAILGFAQLARLDADARGAAHLEKVEAAGHRLLEVVDALLLEADAQAGRLACLPREVDLAELARAALQAHRLDAAHKRQTLTAEVDAGLAPLRTDPALLRIALSNLLSNALKFSPPGSTVVLRVRDRGADGVRLEVQDDGIGIAADRLDELFSDFHQLSEGPARRFDGLGLGLALARRLVGLLRGTIGVRSQLDRGSVFHIDLPREPGGTPA